VVHAGAVHPDETLSRGMVSLTLDDDGSVEVYNESDLLRFGDAGRHYKTGLILESEVALRTLLHPPESTRSQRATHKSHDSRWVTIRCHLPPDGAYFGATLSVGHGWSEMVRRRQGKRDERKEEKTLSWTAGRPSRIGAQCLLHERIDGKHRQHGPV
jgi:hypothetical protein